MIFFASKDGKSVIEAYLQYNRIALKRKVDNITFSGADGTKEAGSEFTRTLQRRSDIMKYLKWVGGQRVGQKSAELPEL